MQHSFIDRYSRLSSPIHLIPVSVKLFAVMFVLLATVAVPFTYHIFFVVVFLVVVAALSRIPVSFMITRLLFLELFVVGVAVLSLFQRNGGVVFLTLFAKSTICLFTIVLFSNTTPFSKLLDTLRRWHVPDLVIAVLALMYRYLFVLVDEMERMQRARSSRTFVKNRSVVWRSRATVVAQSFVRTTERAERIYAAMCARGWR